jgi:hypothetical protein
MGQRRLVEPQAERLTFGGMVQRVVTVDKLNGRKSAPPLSRLTECFPDYARAFDVTVDLVRQYIQH